MFETEKETKAEVVQYAIDISQYGLEEEKEYVYIAEQPKHAKGQRYHLYRAILDVPSYQTKILIAGLTGMDQGRLFAVSINHFVTRFEKAKE